MRNIIKIKDTRLKINEINSIVINHQSLIINPVAVTGRNA